MKSHELGAVTVAATNFVVVDANPTVLLTDTGACGDYSTPIHLDQESCNADDILLKIRDRYDAATERDECNHGFGRELKFLFGRSLSRDDVEETVDAACYAARRDAVLALPAIDWSPLTTDLQDPVNLEEFFEGKGFLQQETGNFQNPEDDRDKDYLDISYYDGDDPRYNDHYPASESSFQAGQAIIDMRPLVETGILPAPTKDLGECQHQSIMCCFTRDRQYSDNNGNCRARNYKDKTPGDNSNLCWTEDSEGIVKTFPGKEEPIYCHGLAWTNNGDDMETRALYNNLFHVAMSDHMVDRGYVGGIDGVQGVCDCIENMSPVTRADCSMVVDVADYTIQIGPNQGDLTVELDSSENDFQIDFQACEGPRFGTNRNKNNDLSSYMNGLHEKGALSTDDFNVMKTILVGYGQPNDRQNEEACAESYKSNFGTDYPEAEE